MRNLLLLMFLGFAVNAFAAYFPLKDTFFTDGEKTLTLENNTVKPANPVVGDSKLYVKSGLLTLLGSDGIESPIGGLRKWATATTYKTDDIIWYAVDEKIYRVVSDHTSGTFATDLAGGKLEEISATEALNHNDSLNKQGGETNNYWHSTLNQHERNKDIEFRNYIKGYDSNAEGTLAGGWVTYDDGAVARPVDGTAGSPGTLTFSRNTTTPLANTGDFSFAKSAANGQGEGVAYAYTVGKADQAQILEVTFDYDTTSANYSCDATTTVCDIGVYSYDGTNTYLIGELPAGKGKFRGVFQTDSTNTHRIIFHVQTTDATAYTVYFDDITVKPQAPAPLGTPDQYLELKTGSTAFTIYPNETGIDQSSKSISAWRVGDKVRMVVTWAYSSAGSGSTMGLDVASMGYPIDISKLRGGASYTAVQSIVGSGLWLGANRITLEAYRETDGKVYFTENGVNNILDPSQMLANHAISVTLEYPVLGWSAQTQVSTTIVQSEIIAYMTSPPAQNLELGTTGVNFGTATNVAGLITKTDAATDATNLDLGESYWTITEDAYYDLSYQIYATRGTSTTAIQTFISVNNDTSVAGRWGNFYSPMTATFTSVTAVGSVQGMKLLKGDTVRVKVIMLGDAATIAASGGQRNSFYIRKVSNNLQQMNKQERVIEIWQGNVGQDWNSTERVTIATTKQSAESSTHGFYNNTTGIFTSDRDGLLKASETVYSNSSFSAILGTYSYTALYRDNNSGGTFPTGWTQVQGNTLKEAEVTGSWYQSHSLNMNVMAKKGERFLFTHGATGAASGTVNTSGLVQSWIME